MTKNKKKRCFSAIVSVVVAVLVGIAIFQLMPVSVKLSPSFQPQQDSALSLVSVFAISFVSMVIIGLVVYYILINRKEEV